MEEYEAPTTLRLPFDFAQDRLAGLEKGIYFKNHEWRFRD
jgi:hypothetical protein